MSRGAVVMGNHRLGRGVDAAMHFTSALDHLIVDHGKLAGAGPHSYSEGNATHRAGGQRPV